MTLNDAFDPDRDNDRPFRFTPRYRAGIPSQISPREFLRLFAKGHIVDGRMGGIVLGKENSNGSARLIFKVGSSYLLWGFVEGGCFLVNREAAAIHRHRLTKICTGLTKNETVPESPTDELGQLIVATAWPHDRIILTDFGQMVVDREPAQKHVIELGRLNANPNPFLVCDYYQIFGCEPGPDGIV